MLCRVVGIAVVNNMEGLQIINNFFLYQERRFIVFAHPGVPKQTSTLRVAELIMVH